MEFIGQIFLDQRFLTGSAVLLLLLSIICQIMIGVLYQNLIKETENMAATKDQLLKQCKLKFANCYKLNMGTINVGVFVDKFLGRIRIRRLSLTAMGHLSGQLMLGSVFAAGLGICGGIIDGITFGALLPYYGLSLFGLYAYFSVSSLVDIPGKQKILRTNLIDYLENHMINHLNISEAMEKAEQDMVCEAEQGGQESGQKPVDGGGEAELEALLREFLA